MTCVRVAETTVVIQIQNHFIQLRHLVTFMNVKLKVQFKNYRRTPQTDATDIIKVN